MGERLRKRPGSRPDINVRKICGPHGLSDGNGVRRHMKVERRRSGVAWRHIW